MKNKLEHGLMVIFEGGEAVGKSAIIQELITYYNDHGYDTVSFREPGGSSTAEKLREIILFNDMDRITELLLYNAARRDNYIKNILPALQDNKLVLMDRFTTSTLVYQGYVGGIDYNTISELNTIVNVYWPYKMEILLDCPIEISMKRLEERDTLNKYDKQNTDFMQQIRTAYLGIFKRYNRFNDSTYIIDSSTKFEETFYKTIGTINAFISNKNLVRVDSDERNL